MSLKYRDNIDDNLNLKNLSICEDLINKNKTQILGKGLQGEVFKAMSPDCGSVVIKKKLIKLKDKKWPDNEQWVRDEFKVEYKVMQLTNRMIDKFICPNFIKAYEFIDSGAGILIMEYADSDAKFLFKDEYYETNIYKSFMCQILIAIYAFSNYTMLLHRDVKPDNILCKKINKNVVFHYKINNRDYYVPTYGYLFMVADFGIASLKIGNRLPDIVNLNYKIIIKFLSSYADKYSGTIPHKDLDNVIKMIGDSEEKNKSNIIIDKMNQLIKSVKNIKNKKMNDYVFDIYRILSSDTNILNILNNNFQDFTGKGNYAEGNIINFTID
jgi:serine/threonine protein kinase